MSEATQTQPATQPVGMLMVKGKECKHSIVYECKDPDAPLKSVYLMKTFGKQMPQAIMVTVKGL